MDFITNLKNVRYKYIDILNKPIHLLEHPSSHLDNANTSCLKKYKKRKYYAHIYNISYIGLIEQTLFFHAHAALVKYIYMIHRIYPI